MRERPLRVPGLSKNAVLMVKYWLLQYDYYTDVVNNKITVSDRERQTSQNIIDIIDTEITKLGYRFGFDVAEMLHKCLTPGVKIKSIGAWENGVFCRFASARVELYLTIYDIIVFKSALYLNNPSVQ